MTRWVTYDTFALHGNYKLAYDITAVLYELMCYFDYGSITTNSMLFRNHRIWRRKKEKEKEKEKINVINIIKELKK